MKWIKTSDELPPFYKRVLCWKDCTNLYGHDWRPIQIFLYSRTPAKIDGNDRVPYRWDCENSGQAFGHEVKYWAEVEEPNGK